MITGIYKIISPSNKIYIGQSVDIERRFKEHKILSNLKQKNKLYNSFNKYGAENHKFEIIEECDIILLNERERYWQDFYCVLDNQGLNCVLTKANGRSGKISEELRLKHSEIRKKLISEGKATIPIFERKKGILNPCYGRKHSEETKAKISQIKKESPTNPYWTGKERSLETINKLKSKRNSKNTIKSIKGISLFTNEILYFRSIADGSEFFNKSRKNYTINQCCLKKSESAFNFKWDYTEDYISDLILEEQKNLWTQEKLANHFLFKTKYGHPNKGLGLIKKK